ncbi:MAG TPA: hypothetical protein VFX38_05435 [Gammaproteobacteria bacterium]|nr:hypothetical protein [Gammaproteobacteria bacterium]
MIVFLPFLWLALWLIGAIAVAAFSGLAPAGAGLTLFLAIFLGGAIGLPLVGGAIWYVGRRLREGD